MNAYAKGQTEVRWTHGGLMVSYAGDVLLIDAPRGIADTAIDVLSATHGVVVTSGRLASLRGLLALLDGVSTAGPRHQPFTVLGPVGDERVPALVDAWTRGWPDRRPIHIDGCVPGSVASIGGIEIRLMSVCHGEPDGGSPQQVQAAPGCAVRLTTPDATIAWVPGAAPDPAVRRACHRADLAVIEVGVVPWPSSDRPWRLTLADALQASADVGELWVMGDDGVPLRSGLA